MVDKKDFLKLFKKSSSKPEYWLMRFIFLRVLGFVYVAAFLSLAIQVIPLIGDNGLLPSDNYLQRVESNLDSKLDAFITLPTIFWLNVSDSWLLFFSWFGVILALIVLFGFANSIIMFLLWIIYLSFVNIGQIWYGFGWEIQLLEIGFMAIFFVPLFEARSFPRMPPPILIIWLFRWITFRIYLGSGLIKIRADECWKDLTCLFYHFETQPIPNPLSPYFHFLPKIVHKLGVIFSHFLQLIVPFFVFWPRILRLIAGILFLIFQSILIVSGNYSFFNWITIVPALALFDDGFLKKFFPRKLVRKSMEAAKIAKKPNKKQKLVWYAVFILFIILSFPVIKNLSSSGQAMNTSFNQWHLVNTYGAFGAVGKERFELVVSGTLDSLIDENTLWKEYEFKAKPTNVGRSLPVIAPYQPRIDWQIWFAAMSAPQNQPWMIHLIWKLLHNDKDVLKLIDDNPFPNEEPVYIKVDLYKYEFLKPTEKDVWKRTYIGAWLPPLSVNTPEFKEFIEINRWNTY